MPWLNLLSQRSVVSAVHRLRGLWLLLLLGALVGPALAEERPDFLFFSDPTFERPGDVKVFAPKLAELWKLALERPEIDMQRMAAESIVAGTAVDVPNLEIAIPRLRELVSDPQTDLIARVAAARALVALNARDSAELLARAASEAPGDLRRVCERALGDWQYAPLRETWRERLASPTTRHRDLVLAIRGLGLAADPAPLDELLKLVANRRSATEVRLEAALAAGRLQTSGLEPAAQPLLESSGEARLVDRLCAARLLARHQTPAAHTALASLGGDTEPAVAGEALRLLNAIDPQLALPLATAALGSPDGEVRRQGVRTLASLPTPERIGLIAPLLDDPVPDLRREVRQKLQGLLESESLRESIWRGTTAVLAAPGWRGQEQAARLVGDGKHQPAAARLLELQTIPRAEARIAAARALREIAVLETCPKILQRCSDLTQQRNGGPTLDGLDEQCAFLFDALAAMQYWEAEPLWRKYIPKQPPMGLYSRSSAIWALGKRYAGMHDPALAKELIERLTDPATVPPELEYVRYTCALSLARMGAKEMVDPMLAWAGANNLRTGQVKTEHALAIRWAVTQLSGEKFPDLVPIPTGKTGWFLEPFVNQ